MPRAFGAGRSRRRRDRRTRLGRPDRCRPSAAGGAGDRFGVRAARRSRSRRLRAGRRAARAHRGRPRGPRPAGRSPTRCTRAQNGRWTRISPTGSASWSTWPNGRCPTPSSSIRPRRCSASTGSTTAFAIGCARHPRRRAPRRPRHGARDDPDAGLERATSTSRSTRSASPVPAHPRSHAGSERLSTTCSTSPPLIDALHCSDSEPCSTKLCISPRGSQPTSSSPWHRTAKASASPHPATATRTACTTRALWIDRTRARIRRSSGPGAHVIRTCGARPRRCCRRDRGRTLRSSPAWYSGHTRGSCRTSAPAATAASKKA